MLNKRTSIALIFCGVILLIVSLSADIIYLGGDLNSFGWKQITGAAAGLILLVVGIFLRIRIFRKVTEKSSSS